MYCSHNAISTAQSDWNGTNDARLDGTRWHHIARDLRCGDFDWDLFTRSRQCRRDFSRSLTIPQQRLFTGRQPPVSHSQLHPVVSSVALFFVLFLPSFQFYELLGRLCRALHNPYRLHYTSSARPLLQVRYAVILRSLCILQNLLIDPFQLRSRDHAYVICKHMMKA